MHPYLCLSTVYLSVHLSIHLSIHPSIHQSIHQSIHPSIHPFVMLETEPRLYVGKDVTLLTPSYTSRPIYLHLGFFFNGMYFMSYNGTFEFIQKPYDNILMTYDLGNSS